MRISDDNSNPLVRNSPKLNVASCKLQRGHLLSYLPGGWKAYLGLNLDMGQKGMMRLHYTPVGLWGVFGPSTAFRGCLVPRLSKCL
jgi:hypothetical protein